MKDSDHLCGGTKRYTDFDAPKEIVSEAQTYFYASTSLKGVVSLSGSEENPVTFLSAFASPVKRGTLIAFSVLRGYSYGNTQKAKTIAVLKDDLMKPLALLTKTLGLAKRNGRFSTTYGLPENFGGSVDIRYESGETIGFADNQSPILSPMEVNAITAFFEDALKGEKADVPDFSEVTAIAFTEKRNDGGFTDAKLMRKPDGSFRLMTRAKYGDPTIYESEKDLGSESADKIRTAFEVSKIAAWEGLPKQKSALSLSEKALAFELKNGETIVIPDGLLLPPDFPQGFFPIELEMTVAN